MTNKADSIKELIDYLVLSHSSGYVIVKRSIILYLYFSKSSFI